MKKSFFLILFIVLFISRGYSQYDDPSQLKTNRNVFERLINSGFEKYLDDYFSIGGNIFVAKFYNTYEESKFLFEVLKSRYSNYKILKDTISDSINYQFLFKNINFVTSYINVKKGYINNKTIKRNIKVSFDVDIINNKVSGSNSVIAKNYSEVYTDSILYDKLDYVESGEYGFLKGELPKQSFMEKYLVPSVFLAVSAMTIILFFFIRSN